MISYFAPRFPGSDLLLHSMLEFVPFSFVKTSYAPGVLLRSLIIRAAGQVIVAVLQSSPSFIRRT